MKNGPYILVLAPDDFPGKKYREKYIYEHTLIWWKITKIIPPNGYQIHHKNNDKRDNRFENLEMISKYSHSEIHGKRKEKGITLLICNWCKNPFSLETRNYKCKKKSGQLYFHCSRSCQVHTQQKILHRSSDGSKQRTVNPWVAGSSPAGAV